MGSDQVLQVRVDLVSEGCQESVTNAVDLAFLVGFSLEIRGNAARGLCLRRGIGFSLGQIQGIFIQSLRHIFLPKKVKVSARPKRTGKREEKRNRKSKEPSI
jgi:hypothetical protein